VQASRRIEESQASQEGVVSAPAAEPRRHLSRRTILVSFLVLVVLFWAGVLLLWL
jgi:hypothetical protein